MENENTVVVSAMAESKRAIEAILLVSSEPTPTQLLAQLLEMPIEVVEEQCQELAMAYDLANHGFQLVQVAGGWRYQTHPDLAPYVERFAMDGQSTRLSTAATETLAIVAYKQPISRAQVSAIRGVNVDAVLRTLVQRGYVEEVGRDLGAGQAVLFGTTQYFLERVGLNETTDLPALGEFVPSAEVVEALEQTLKVEIAPEELDVEEESATDQAPAGEAAAGPDAEVGAQVDGDAPVGPVDQVEVSPTADAEPGGIDVAESEVLDADGGAVEPLESEAQVDGEVPDAEAGAVEGEESPRVDVEADAAEVEESVTDDEGKVEVVSEMAVRSGAVFSPESSVDSSVDEPADEPRSELNGDLAAAESDEDDHGLSAEFLATALTRTVGFDHIPAPDDNDLEMGDAVTEAEAVADQEVIEASSAGLDAPDVEAEQGSDSEAVGSANGYVSLAAEQENKAPLEAEQAPSEPVDPVGFDDVAAAAEASTAGAEIVETVESGTAMFSEEPVMDSPGGEEVVVPEFASDEVDPGALAEAEEPPAEDAGESVIDLVDGPDTIDLNIQDLEQATADLDLGVSDQADAVNPEAAHRRFDDH